MKKEFYFEVSWEVANKGIYTVIRSKAGTTTAELGANYCMLGIYNHAFASTEVEFCKTEAAIPNEHIREAVRVLRQHDISVHCGYWLIEGSPFIVLFDIGSGYKHIDEWRHELNQRLQYSLPVFEQECSDVVVFGGLTAWFLEEFRRIYHPSTHSVVAHFHEWLAGGGLLLLRKRNANIGTVFTTHATILGRYLAASPFSDLYNKLYEFDAYHEAGRLMIYHKFLLEKEAAHSAHVFTTVSDITAEESTAFLKRKPDYITPNGINVKKFVAMHEFQNQHARSKKIISQFVQGHFSGNYDFDLDKTIYFFSAGRYEYNNKGIDLYIESLARLDSLLRLHNLDVTVVAFLIFPTPTNNYNVESLKGHALQKQLRDVIGTITGDIEEKMIDAVARGGVPQSSQLLTREHIIRIKRFIASSRRSGWAPICTHNVVDDSGDKILNNLRRLNLLNAPNDRVKVIFHPEFLNSVNTLFPMDYEEFIKGCHLGVFPSYYEPWGYTPAECAVMGVPSVSTNLSGFGQYVKSIIGQPEHFGLYTLERRFQSFNESVDQLSQIMLNFCRQTRKQRIIQRNRTERVSEILDWKILGSAYKMARKAALNRIKPESYPEPVASNKREGAMNKRLLSIVSNNSSYEPHRDDYNDDDEEEEKSYDRDFDIFNFDFRK